ncbi:hypothetical protein AVEN_268144-1 [Araneus ventricosus]|uniref:Uncharacterized protein n=1 Tax=Araneus ventricosus TaxID=182803 RepID=A0A4Y2W3H5_ARAVE|nr:hypothetical protein AVEN_268144-1 [Araneus ventricosus]
MIFNSFPLRNTGTKQCVPIATSSIYPLSASLTFILLSDLGYNHQSVTLIFSEERIIRILIHRKSTGYSDQQFVYSDQFEWSGGKVHGQRKSQGHQELFYPQTLSPLEPSSPSTLCSVLPSIL